MTPRTRWCLFGLAGFGAVCFLLLPFVGSADPEAAGLREHGLIIMGFVSLTMCLAMLHGQGLCCPSCRRWWARKDVGNEFAESDLIHPGDDRPEDGTVVQKEVTYHYKHECVHCGHHWRTAFTDRYECTVRRRRESDLVQDEKRRPSNRPL